MANNQNEKSKQTQRQEPRAFREVLGSLPSVLLKEVMKRAGAALLSLILMVIMVALTKDVTYCLGFVLPLVFAYMALDIVWKYGAGKIECHRMVVCKAHKTLSKQIVVQVRKAESCAAKDVDVEMFRYQLTVPMREHGTINQGTVMDIYAVTPSPYVALAYNIVGQMDLTAEWRG